MRGLAMLLVGSLLAVGCGTSSEIAGDRGGSRPPTVTVNTVDGAPKLATAVGVGGTVVAQTWMWDDRLFTWSDDDGQNWHRSATPDSRSDAVSRRLVALGDTLVVVGAPTSLPVRDPGIWRSIDAGKTFQQSTGVATSDEEGVVTDVVEVDGRLVAMGVMRPGDPTMAGLEPPQATRWVSDDRGRSWTRTDLPPSTPITTSLVATRDGTLIATGAGNPRSADVTTEAPAIRSTDRGRTWAQLAIPGLEPTDRVTAPTVVGDTVFVNVDTTTWASTDGGERWRKLGRAPTEVDSEDTSPEWSTVQVQAGSHNVLAATVLAFFDEEHYLATLAFSNDDGARWQAASLPVQCVGAQATSKVSDIVRLDGTLVAAWNCSGGGDHGGWLLTSVDDGRTWQVDAHKATAGMELSAPVAIDSDHALLWAGPNAEAAPRVMLTVQAARRTH